MPAAPETPATPLAAFPGAEGFGALATGGRGGEVYHVTTLADAGPGSFRDAVSRPGRTVVFDVGGVIRLASTVQVASRLTIAGETAPGEGICLYGQSVSFGGQQNIIVRYVRFRQGISGDRGKKSLGLDRAANIIVDHCTISWGRWDDLGITVGSHDITIQHCLLAEAIHPQSFGALIDNVERVTLVRNLWMSNESRNPKAKGTIQYLNNVVYNWGITGLCGGHSAQARSLDVIGNTFIKGPSSNDRWAGQFLASDHVYQEGNYIDLDRDGTLNGRVAQRADFHDPADTKYTLPTFVSEPALRPAIPVRVTTAAEAYATIVAEAGCSRPRDAVDRRLIDELQSLGRRGATVPHKDERGEALVGGQPELPRATAAKDTDRDGLPDAWEAGQGLNPRDPTDAAIVTRSGYTHLERYLHERADRAL
ncbi:hypothetical protein DB354_09125 [Opitutus sp. ER46]|nr:hypothetical protein DB354_09125 [Opitutus sp. ER46]